MKYSFILAGGLMVASMALAEETTVAINVPAAGSVTQDDGLEAWSRIFEVTSHPRLSLIHI